MAATARSLAVAYQPAKVCPKGQFCSSPVEKPKSITRRDVAAAAPVGCRLSANWFVSASAKWDGTTFRYGVLNSPGPLLVGGSPDGTRSEWFTWRGSDRTWDGVYSSRDTSKPAYVYRTLGESSLEPFVNVNKVVQVAMAPSGIFCLVTINRP